jgi:hypothetical protein
LFISPNARRMYRHLFGGKKSGDQSIITNTFHVAPLALWANQPLKGDFATRGSGRVRPTACGDLSDCLTGCAPQGKRL